MCCVKFSEEKWLNGNYHSRVFKTVCTTHGYFEYQKRPMLGGVVGVFLCLDTRKFI